MLNSLLRLKQAKALRVAFVATSFVASLILGALPVANVSTVQAASVCSPDDSTIDGYWKLDDAIASGTAADSSGNGNDGTYTNGPTQSADVPPAIVFDDPFSRDFDGSDDYVDLGTAFSNTINFSVMAWVNPDVIGIDQQIISKGYDGSNTQWELKTTTAGGKVSFQSFNGSNVGVESLSTLPNSTWTHVAGTYDGTTWRIYINGVLDNSAVAAGPTLTANAMYIGAVDANGSPAQFWDGKIDEVRVYSRVVGVDEILKIANGSCDNTVESSGGGGNQGIRRRKNNFVRYLLGLGNANFGDVGIAPFAFGGPGPGNGNGDLTNDQLVTMCEVRKQIDMLMYFDLTEFMAENYAHMYDVTEELILDILENGTGCDVVEAAQAMQEARELQAIADAEAERYAAELAAIEARKPTPVDFAVDSEGYPVSTDMIWNACIRNYQVFIGDETKPLNCRRYHEGHTWEHPDTLVSFKWSDRFVKHISVKSHTVATYEVPAPSFVAITNTTDKGHVVTRFVLPSEMSTQTLAQKGMNFIEKLDIRKEIVQLTNTAIQTIVTNITDIVPTTTVLSEEVELTQ